jgi:hypothetical protein
LPLLFCGLCCCESQTNVIYAPASLNVPQGVASLTYFIKKALPVISSNRVGEGLRKKFQPIEKFSRKLGRPLDDLDVTNRETRIHQKLREIFR